MEGGASAQEAEAARGNESARGTTLKRLSNLVSASLVSRSRLL